MGEKNSVRPRKVPLRQCTGCGERKEKKELVRIIQLLYNKDVYKCSSCGGKILPLSHGQYHVTPKPHMIC